MKSLSCKIEHINIVPLVPDHRRAFNSEESPIGFFD